jgi:hypothetical protein
MKLNYYADSLYIIVRISAIADTRFSVIADTVST